MDMKAEYIDHMGSDLTVVNSARVSFDKESDFVWESMSKFLSENPNEIPTDKGYVFVGGAIKTLNEKDKKLIDYLAKHNHWTPFSHCFVTLRETVPIFVARQRFKHTVGFSYNEVSRRYVDDPPKFYQPEKWRGRPTNKKQGSSDKIIETFENSREKISDVVDAYHIQVSKLYQNLLDEGIAPEQARMILPQSMYTSYYVSGSLAAWARAYKLRNSPDAQFEINELAKSWGKILKNLFPVSWTALT